MEYGRENGHCVQAGRHNCLSTLAAIVLQYRLRFCTNAHTELTPFKTYPFPTALRKSLHAAYSHLQKIAPKLRRAKTFDALHALVTLHTQIPGIGELYRYDTALRLAAHLRLHPTRIYLHAGTRTGARNLGLNHKHPSLPRSAFHHLKPLRSLLSHQLEDLLCIYKNQLKKTTANP